jgi:hypothetical protein
METTRVDISYRPLRIAWAIQSEDFDSFREQGILSREQGISDTAIRRRPPSNAPRTEPKRKPVQRIFSAAVEKRAPLGGI